MLSWILEKALYACPEVFGAGAVKVLALRRVEDGPLCLMAPPLGFHRFTVFIWMVLSCSPHALLGSHLPANTLQRRTTDLFW